MSDKLQQERIDALLVPLLPMFFVQRARIVDLAARNKLPTMYDVREYVVQGGLAAYGPSFQDLFRRAAVYVDKILKEPSPATCPSSSPASLSWSSTSRLPGRSGSRSRLRSVVRTT